MEAVQSKTINRAATIQKPAAQPTVQRKSVASNSTVQLSSMKVSSPKDLAEREADATAEKIMRMAIPESAISSVRTGHGNVFRQVKPEEKDKKLQRKFQSPYIARFADSGIFTQRRPEHSIARKAEGQPNVASNVSAEIQSSMAAGSPLPLSVRRFMEPRFQADFSGVKIHTGDTSAKLNRQLSAQAFTVGNQIFFGKNQFQPERSEGKELIAHELTHTIQQGSAIQRRESVTVTQQSPVQVQRLGITDALDYFADKANLIPGFRMFTIILGVNPINMSRVDRSAANILRALVEFLPGGGLIVQALDNYGIFDRIGNWVDQQLRSLGMTGSVIRAAINQFLDSLSWRDIFDLGGVWNRAKRIFTEPIDRIISFGRSLVTGIIQFIKDAILRPLAQLASQTRGYDLLKAVLGQDPITGEPVPRNADTLIGGFMKLIGQEEVWNNLKRANAVARAWTWFQGALSGLLGFVRQIPSMFLQALRSLEIADLVLLPRAFARVGSAFASFLGQFFSWAGQQVMNLLQIIFEVVAPGAMPYIRRAAGAFRSIIQNPIGFVGNLVRAGILGFRQFAGRFVTHLRTSLIGWLTGALSGAGVYIPQAFTLPEIVKFVLSVLNVTWQFLRQKLVRAISEPAVRALETGFDLVVTLVRDGPAAAWEKIQESLSNLREMVMEQIISFVSSRIVQAAITRLVTSLNPAGAFIQAIIATYNTIMFFVERLRQIAQVAMSFIDSISAIAGGNLTTAANRVEQTMGGLLVLVISFLARLVGLGRVSDAVTNIINRVRAPIDRALDRVVDWIVATARRLGRFIAQAGVPQDPNERLRLAGQAAIIAARRLSGRVTIPLLNPLLAVISTRYGLTRIEPYLRAGRWWVRATINPTTETDLGVSSEGADGTTGEWWRTRSPVDGGTERHTLYFSGESEGASLMIATRPVTWDAYVGALVAYSSPQATARKTDAIAAANTLRTTMRRAPATFTPPQTKRQQVATDLNELALRVGALLRLGPPPGGPIGGGAVAPPTANAYPGTLHYPRTRTVPQLWDDLLPTPLAPSGAPGARAETPSEREFRRVMARGVLLEQYSGPARAIAQAMIDHNNGRVIKGFNLTENDSNPVNVGAHARRLHTFYPLGDIRDARDLACRALFNDPTTGGNWRASAYNSVAAGNTAIRTALNGIPWPTLRERIISTAGNASPTGNLPDGGGPATVWVNPAGAVISVAQLPSYMSTRVYRGNSLAAAAGNRMLFPGDTRPGLVGPPLVNVGPRGGIIHLTIRVSPAATQGWYVYTAWPE